MELMLPDFSDPHLWCVTLCCAFKTGESAQLPPVEKRTRLECRYGDGFWCRLICEPRGIADEDPGSIHLHVDVQRAFGSRKSEAKNQLSEVQEVLIKFLGCTGDVHVAATYRVPEANVPQTGLVRAFFGLATEQAGMQLTFRGATMAINEDGFDTLSWRIDDGELSSSLDAYLEVEIDQNTFTEVTEFVTERLRSLVLGGKP